jgi:hypothetical protein
MKKVSIEKSTLKEDFVALNYAMMPIIKAEGKAAQFAHVDAMETLETVHKWWIVRVLMANRDMIAALLKSGNDQEGGKILQHSFLLISQYNSLYHGHRSGGL